MAHDELTVFRFYITMYDWNPARSHGTIGGSIGVIAYHSSEAMKNMPNKGLRNSYTKIILELSSTQSRGWLRTYGLSI